VLVGFACSAPHRFCDTSRQLRVSGRLRLVEQDGTTPFGRVDLYVQGDCYAIVSSAHTTLLTQPGTTSQPHRSQSASTSMSPRPRSSSGSSCYQRHVPRELGRSKGWTTEATARLLTESSPRPRFYLELVKSRRSYGRRRLEVRA
jgi:hypothetical protein